MRRTEVASLPTIAAFNILIWSIGLAWGAQTLDSNALPADTLIFLHRGACEHRCPVYNIVIFSDGTAIFDGRSYVRRRDVIRTRIGLDATRSLIDEAKTLGFFDLKERYLPGVVTGCSATKPDAPTAIASVSVGGMAKTIIHYQGCEGTESKQLGKFEQDIDRAINSSSWTK
jgi:hypothetical protein